MIAWGIVIAVLIVIALLRFGVSVEYSKQGVLIEVLAGPFRVKVYPLKEKPEDEEKKRRKEAKKRAKEERKKAKAKDKPPFKLPGGLSSLLDMVSPLVEMLSRVKRRILIKKLMLHLTVAGDDAAKTAVMYGGVNAALGELAPLLDNNFRVKKRDFRVDVDFLETEQKIYVNAAISLAVWEAFYIAFALFPILKIFLKRDPAKKVAKDDAKKDGKEVEENGKTSD